MTTRLREIHIPIMIVRIEEYGETLVSEKFENNWMVRLRKQSRTGTQHLSITRHPFIWNLTFGFEECNEWLVLVSYCHNQTVGFSERRAQSLVKVGQTQSKLIYGSVNTGLGEIHIRILVIGIEKLGDILVLVKFKNNWMLRLTGESRTGTQHMFIKRRP